MSEKGHHSAEPDAEERAAEATAALVPPVTKNEEVVADVVGIGHDGQGVGRVNGYTLFIQGALPGEQVRAKVLKVKKHYGYGKLLEVIKPSPDRTEPPCPVYRQCGGCQLQHLSYEAQLRWKRQMVVDNLERIGKIFGATVHETIGMEEPWRYRNKSQVPFGADREGGLIAGFYALASHRIIDMDTCLIQNEKNDEVLRKVKHIARELDIPVYDETKHEGVLRHVVIRYGFHTGEIMVVLVTNGPHIPRRVELVQAIRKQVPGVASICQNINSERTNVIFGPETRVLWGKEVIYDQIGDIRFSISARSFYQVNPVQTKVLYEKALEYAGLTGNETVIDAYCGVGTISLFLARRAKKVYGVEIVPEAVEDARKNAELNGIRNVEFTVGKAEEVLPAWKAEGLHADVIVVDPPRKGCDAALLDTILLMQPQRVVYVSCNPSTLARDLRVLEDGGYRTVEVQPVDMFPHTVHVECCVSLVRK